MTERLQVEFPVCPVCNQGLEIPASSSGEVA